MARRCAGVTSDRYSGKARLESATESAFSMSASSLSMCRHATDKRRAWFELRDSSGIKLRGRRKQASRVTGAQLLRNLLESEAGGEPANQAPTKRIPSSS